MFLRARPINVLSVQIVQYENMSEMYVRGAFNQALDIWING